MFFHQSSLICTDDILSLTVVKLNPAYLNIQVLKYQI